MLLDRYITKLKIQNFRCFEEQSIEFNSRFNLILGENGSGKTTVLEALYYLFLGKSFRTLEKDPLYSYGSKDFILFAELKEKQVEYKIGLAQKKNKKLN